MKRSLLTSADADTLGQRVANANAALAAIQLKNVYFLETLLPQHVTTTGLQAHGAFVLRDPAGVPIPFMAAGKQVADATIITAALDADGAPILVAIPASTAPPTGL